MTVLTTSLDRRSDMFAANAAAMRGRRRSAGEGRGDPRGRRGAKPLTDDERRWYPQIVQRIAALLALGASLDALYQKPLSVHLQPKSWGSFDNRA
jgi:hypothetical protein